MISNPRIPLSAHGRWLPCTLQFVTCWITQHPIPWSCVHFWQGLVANQELFLKRRIAVFKRGCEEKRQCGLAPHPKGLCFHCPTGIGQRTHAESIFATFRCCWICCVLGGRVASTTAWAYCRTFWHSGLHWQCCGSQWLLKVLYGASRSQEGPSSLVPLLHWQERYLERTGAI